MSKSNAIILSADGNSKMYTVSEEEYKMLQQLKEQQLKEEVDREFEEKKKEELKSAYNKVYFDSSDKVHELIVKRDKIENVMNQIKVKIDNTFYMRKHAGFINVSRRYQLLIQERKLQEQHSRLSRKFFELNDEINAICDANKKIFGKM